VANVTGCVFAKEARRYALNGRMPRMRLLVERARGDALASICRLSQFQAEKIAVTARRPSDENTL
jgi:hypothetical protein